MKNKEKNPVIMIEDDHRLIRSYVRPSLQESEMSLAYELDRAIIVQKYAFPPHVVRLDSQVSVLELKSNQVFDFSIVTPERADIARRKISFLSPIVAALIGFRKGEEVRWKMPSGMKKFRILDVINKLAVQ